MVMFADTLRVHTDLVVEGSILRTYSLRVLFYERSRAGFYYANVVVEGSILRT